MPLSRVASFALCALSTGIREWIQRAGARSLEVGHIPCYHGKLMFKACSRDQAVGYWQTLVWRQATPAVGDLCRYRKNSLRVMRL
jgi:hypothetical protein